MRLLKETFTGVFYRKVSNNFGSNSKRLSIIVPIYNVEPYVERCLRSLENQDIPRVDIEIICINDGSPDNSRNVVVRLQSEFDNIILIEQENQGVSCARNNGIDKARGKYLVFIDPDDYVDANCFNRILKNAEKHDVQVSFLGFTVLNVKGNIQQRVFNENHASQIHPGIGSYFLARCDDQPDPDRMVAVLFRTDFLNTHDLRYLPDVPFLEDGEFISRILCLADRCIFDGHPFYQRTTRPGSATNSRLFNSKSAIDGFVKAAVNLRNFRNQMFLSLPQKEFMNQPILKFVLLSINATSRLKKFKVFLTVISTLQKNGFIIMELDGCHKYYQNLGKLYNLSPFLLYSYMVSRAGVIFIRNLRSKGLRSDVAKGEII